MLRLKHLRSLIYGSEVIIIKIMRVLLLSVLCLASISCLEADCPLDEAVAAFKAKKIINPWPYFPNNPYQNETEASMKIIDQTIANKVMVCALRYEDADKLTYNL